MKKIILTTILVLFFAAPVFAGNYLSLTDNTAISDTAMLRCLSKGDTQKVLIVTGSGGTVDISFDVVEDSITVKTITLSAAGSEKYVADHPMSTFKVDWTETSGTASATLGCWE